MFPHTHIYCVKKITDRSNPLLFLGSVFPDITISGKFDRRDTHLNGQKMYHYIADKYPVFLDFATGYLTHAANPKGIDYYCDDHPQAREGYAFIKSKPLISLVKNATGLDIFLSTVRAHNFIEMAIEILLVKKFPELLDDVKIAEKIENGQIFRALSGIYNKNEMEIENALNFYFEVIPRKADTMDMAKSYANILKIRDKIEIDIDKTQMILEKAVKIIEFTYMQDLDEMIKKTGKMLKCLQQ